jgi:uncharacterized SAM-binding protein YcdF (DUF218 family)
MWTLFILGLFLLALFKKMRRSCLTLGALLTLLTLFGVLPSLFLSGLQSRDRLVTAAWHNHQPNVIVVLGGGLVRANNAVVLNVYSQARVLTGIRLYYECKRLVRDCKLLFSGGFAREDVAGRRWTEAALFREAAMGVGVPLEDIIQEDQSLNTWQNAMYTRRLAEHLPAHQMVLVSSALHLKRSSQYFNHFGLWPQLIAADDMPLQHGVPSGYQFALSDACWHEYLGMMRFHLYNVFDLNPKALPHLMQ